MPLFRRYDGDLVASESLEQHILSFIMPRRNQAVVYYQQDIDARPVLGYLAGINAGRERKDRITLFHVTLAAMTRAIALRPKMNRFVVGNCVYQRKWIDASFVVKKDMKEDATASAIKVRFDPDGDLADVVRRINVAVERGRSSQHTSSETLMNVVLKLPRQVIRLIMWLLKLLDYYNLMPRSMIDSDELYTSLFVANLGGVGLKAPFHHLYEWGTSPIFGVVGQVEKTPVVNEAGELEARDVLPLRWTFDERIADGLYCARALDLVRHFLINPTLLETPPSKVPPEPNAASSDSPYVAVL